MEKNSFKKFIKTCPLVCLTILSIVLYTVYAFFGVLKGDYKLKISMEHTLFMSAMLPKQDLGMNMAPVDTTDETATDTDAFTSIESTETATNSDVPAENTPTNTTIPTQYVTVSMRTARSPYYEDCDRVAQTTAYDYHAVSDLYFNDAVFIGDSRVEGLHDYSPYDGADYLYKDGVSIWNLMTDTMANGNTVSYALSTKQYNKVYIMCGINELGTGFASDYQAQYKKVLDEIRSLQPNAVIFVMGIMHVTENYATNSDVYNNDNIDCRNALVAEYADGKSIFYLDMNEVVCDMTSENVCGGVKSDYSNDGVHLQAQYYELWREYLNQHGINDAMFPDYQKNGAPSTEEVITTEAPTDTTTEGTTQYLPAVE